MKKIDETSTEIGSQAATDVLIDSPAPDAFLETIATDEFAGIGGAYIFDPATGKRSPAPPEQ